MSTPDSARLDSLRSQGQPLYPARCLRDLPLAELGTCTAAFAWVSGRLLSLTPTQLCLEDATARADLPISPVATGLEGLTEADVVSLRVARQAAGWAVLEVQLLAPSCGRPAFMPPLGPLPRLERRPGGGASLGQLEGRARVIRALRQFFESRGFLEVETPQLAWVPGLEPHLDPFASAYRPTPDAPGVPMYLLTSPEYCLKRLLVAGVERCFQLSRVFRNGEAGPFHNPEFTMLEWYRAYASYVEIADDLEGLILFLAEGLGLGREIRWQGKRVDLTPPWPRVTVREAFRARTGIDLLEAQDAPSLQAAARSVGLPLPEGESWEEGFFRLLVEKVEPGLGEGRPVFLLDYPAPLAALSKVRPGPLPVAERFELYIAGVEVGNAYSELNDPIVQRARFEEERALRARLGLPVFEPDQDYLRALEEGLPPTGGIAVGVDRLVMLLLNAADVRQTLAFPFVPPLR